MNEKIRSIAHSKKVPLTPRRLPRKKTALRQVHQVNPLILRVKNFPMHFEFSKFYADFEYFGQFGEVQIKWLNQSMNFPHFSDLIVSFGHPLSASLAYLVILISLYLPLNNNILRLMYNFKKNFLDLKEIQVELKNVFII